ncbi:tRNA (adenosine(37)-N6)-threonylcarbamoyltransferase complex ATPase subunit type 1 TsaE [Helcococcus ovis]|uniref:tRNA (adenosine(37)-N6)-threonylcarbamoyltransferase complex ATPase subunit type 1 TsaE n=1 Tax=Helcococcus ovis TaxID=72026 RepID=UPI00106F8320|nr:tRNA (adenosine(37)-N6)-threonylcarbamoyltransferase complex ATPase subunit type 1 TsaE [Helcococcus ovis]TFF66688.1 tRNA (adenosine(37)-N6)-threonylcarbamoyltransferase complex ATPase subunit type 1 TsaE [Helcococcus ovis]WNZ00758.1 tRNA (adenosine(37)-N6)-threonylcarbamoyltransferase complex ATPase subunit type 1 TsaE [Helcococcus ovis]
MKREIKDLRELENFGKKLAKELKFGDVISLKGDLGAGKTTLVQFVAKELGVEDYVTSPTFSIVNIYEGQQKIYHMDLYRLEDPEELEQIDFENYFYPEGITFIEWAEKGEYYLPEDMIEISIEIGLNKRIIYIEENNIRAKEIGEKLNEDFGD